MADASYSAEFSVSLDKLKKGVVDAKSALNDLEKSFVSAGEKAGGSLTAALETGLKNASAALKQAEKDVRAYADVTEDAAGAVDQSIKAHEDYIATLIQLAKAHGDVDGSIKKTIKSEKDLIKSLHEGKASSTGMAKAFENEMAKASGQGFNKFEKEAGEKLAQLSQSLGQLGGPAKKAGDAIGKNLGSGILSFAPKIAAAFGAIQAAAGPILIVVGLIVAAVKLIGGQIAKAVEKQKAFNKNVDTMNGAYKRAQDAINGVSKEQKKQNELAKAGEDAATAQQLIWKKIGDWFSNTFSPILEGVKGVIGVITNAVGAVADALGLISQSEIDAAQEAQKVSENWNSVENAADNYQKELEKINLLEKAGADVTGARNNAAKTYLDNLIAQRVEMAAQVGEQSESVKKMDALIEDASKLVDFTKEESGAKEKQLTLIDERAALEAKVAQQMGEMRRQAARINDEAEREKFIREQTNSIYSSAEKELDGLIVKYKATRENAKETFQLADAYRKVVEDTTAKVTDLERAQKELKEIQKKYDEEIEKIILSQARGEITAAQAAELRKQAAIDHNAAVLEMAKNYDDATQAAAGLGKALKDVGEKTDKMTKRLSFDDIYAAAKEASGSILQITQAMAEDQIETINDLLEQQKELIDKQYEDTMSRLEEERQAALEAAGFVQAITEEGQAMALEAAMASGDEGLIYKEKRRQEELAINKKFNDAEKKANDDKVAAEKKAEEDAARQIAQIQYQQAMAEWTNSLIQAGVNTAVAATKALPNFAAAIAVGILGALQIAVIAANKPKNPAFADGGVVGLPRTYRSAYADGGIVEANTPRGIDAVDTTLANREMVLNDDQQANLFGAIAGGQIGGGETTLIIQLVMDDKIISESTVRAINNGMTQKIEARMIA